MDKMLPIIMNTSFERLAVIDDYTSFIWTTRYYASGDFELVVGVNSKNINLFAKDYYIMREDDENIGVIEHIIIQRNEDGADQIIVSGQFLAGSILGRRIIVPQTTVSGAVDVCISRLIGNNIINSSIAARNIPYFTCLTFTMTETMQGQYTGDNLLEVISTICEKYGLGFKVLKVDSIDFPYELEFQIYKGTDHTYDQSVNPWVIFSDKYDNLLSSEYEENYKEIATAAYVAGEGEGLDRKTLWVTDGTTGLDRHEVYVDRRDLQNNDGEISDAEYTNLLQEAGKEKLTTYTTAFSGTVYFDNVKYKEDVNIGDICVIENERWGIYINARLVEVIESVSETGEYSIVPTFGI